jgi:hypothetical protein
LVTLEEKYYFSSEACCQTSSVLDNHSRKIAPGYSLFPLLYLILQVPSLRILCKVSPVSYWIFIPLFLMAIGGYYLLLVRSRDNRFLEYGALSVMLLAGIILANFYLYPMVDARKEFMLGSDQDDALIAVVKAIFSGKSPYAVETYLNTGASTGPGWAMLMAPFVLLDSYFLITPCLFGVLFFLLYRQGWTIREVNLYLLLLISSPAFWELMTNGSDLIAFGTLCLISLLLWKRASASWWKALILVLLSMVLTARIVFVYLVPIFAWLLAGKIGKSWLKFAIILLLLSLGIHFLFYQMGPENYTPLLLIDKGLGIISFPELLLAIPAGAVLLYLSLQSTSSLRYQIGMLGAWLLIPLGLIALFSFNYQGNILLQYPFTYLGPQLPVLLVFVVESLNDQQTTRPRMVKK